MQPSDEAYQGGGSLCLGRKAWTHRNQFRGGSPLVQASDGSRLEVRRKIDRLAKLEKRSSHALDKISNGSSNNFDVNTTTTSVHSIGGAMNRTKSGDHSA